MEDGEARPGQAWGQKQVWGSALLPSFRSQQEKPLDLSSPSSVICPMDRTRPLFHEATARAL